jgi:hypothetical protein
MDISYMLHMDLQLLQLEQLVLELVIAELVVESRLAVNMHDLHSRSEEERESGYRQTFVPVLI